MENKFLIKLFAIIVTLCVFSLSFTTFCSATTINNMAFSVGTDYGWHEINTTSDAKTAATQYWIAGYSSFYSVQPTVDILRGNFSNGTKRLSSNILFLSGHSNRTAMYFDYNGNGGSYKTGVYYLQNTNQDGYELAGLVGNCNRESVILATFAGCNTANKSESEYNLCHIITKNLWAQAAVGWYSEVDDSANRKFCEAYNKALANGYGLLDAIYYGLSAYTYDPATNISNIGLYADNSGLVIKKSARSLLTNDDSKLKSLNYIDISSMTDRTFDKENMDNIYNFIKNFNPDFDVNNYDIKISNICDNNYAITLTLRVGKYITNSVYNVFIKDNYISYIVDNSIPLNNNEKESLKKESENILKTNEYKKIAKNNILNKNNGVVSNQNVTYYYDINTNTKKCIVYNTHILEGTSEAIAVLSEEIEL